MTETETSMFTSFPKAQREAVSKKKLVPSGRETSTNNSFILNDISCIFCTKLNIEEEKKHKQKVLIPTNFVQVIPSKCSLKLLINEGIEGRQ